MYERESLQTGIDILDRELGGGIPSGTVTALSADPASQSELFLYELADTRRTVYLSTVRAVDAIEDLFEYRRLDQDSVETIRIDDDDPIDHAQAIVADLDGVNVIVDPVDVLEACDSRRYRRFLAELKRQVSESTAMACLHCLRDESKPANRRYTVHVADLVFQLTTEIKGDSIENRLAVPKFRTGQSVEEVIKLDLTSEVEVDLSRNIL